MILIPSDRTEFFRGDPDYTVPASTRGPDRILPRESKLYSTGVYPRTGQNSSEGIQIIQYRRLPWDRTKFFRGNPNYTVPASTLGPDRILPRESKLYSTGVYIRYRGDTNVFGFQLTLYGLSCPRQSLIN